MNLASDAGAGPRQANNIRRMSYAEEDVPFQCNRDWNNIYPPHYTPTVAGEGSASPASQPDGRVRATIG